MTNLILSVFQYFFFYISISLESLPFVPSLANAIPNQLKPCTKEDIEYKILPCNSGKRKAVPYMLKPCDLKATGSIEFPMPIANLTCKCPPGSGEKFIRSGTIKCEKCKAGQFSHGGELIDNWKNWNGTKGVPGSGYDAYPYCSDFLTGRYCETWKPSGGNSEYLISGNTKNHSLELKCFEQSILVLRRIFVGNKGENKIRFSFKVEGAPCRRGSTVCSNGLYFYVNGERKMKKDVQFMWKEFSTDLKAGGNEFKFIYHRSCVKEDILDVAFIKHISMIGTETPNTTCSDCPKGTYSNREGSSECMKCLQNTYQDNVGLTSCLACPNGYFSRIGAIKCMKLPKCTKNDYYVLPDPIQTCFKRNGKWFRKQKVLLANWPGKTKHSCIESTDKPSGEEIQCKCQPGYYLDVIGTPSCERCRAGTYSDGLFLSCRACSNGSAAVPGFYYSIMDGPGLPEVLKVTCSGQFCNGTSNGTDGKYWLPRGDHMATKRLLGNFELKTESPVMQIDYHLAKLSYKCAVDCRMQPNGKRLAKHDHCFFKMMLKLGNETIVRANDCVNRYRPHLRNGTKISHSINLSKPGNYTFYTVFHHEDEGNISLVSYEARLYDVQLFGSVHGSAKSCVVCKSGTRLSDDKRFCIKCPKGTFSKNASSVCTPCPDNHFSDKEGSAGCKACGAGTISNNAKDGCDYQGCKFSPVQGINYDLSPLKADGGPMYQVRTYVKEVPYQYPLLYYINICSQNHDNSSCMVYKRKMNVKTRKVQIFEKTHLKTMACKRWAFDRYNSYSIGEVMSFNPWKENITRGLMINLTGGFKCYHKVYNKYVMPSTSILMECDLHAGEGHPEPLSNLTAIDEKHCQYELRWRSYYACRLCSKSDYTTVTSKCVNGTMTVSQKSAMCRSPTGVNQYFTKRIKCEEPASQTPLIITVVVAVFLIGVLVVFLLYYIRRARQRTGNILKSFHKVQGEDEDELVDNMQK